MGNNVVCLEKGRVSQLRQALSPTWKEVQPLMHEACIHAVKQFVSEGSPNLRRILLSAPFSHHEAKLIVLFQTIAEGKGDHALERETLEQIAVVKAHEGLSASDILYTVKVLMGSIQNIFSSVGPEWVTLLDEFACPILAHVAQVTSDILQNMSRGRRPDHPELLRWIQRYSPPNATQPRFFDLCMRRAAEPHTCGTVSGQLIFPLKRRFFSMRKRYLYVFDIEPEGVVSEDGPTGVIDLARVRRIEKANEDEDVMVALKSQSSVSPTSSMHQPLKPATSQHSLNSASINSSASPKYFSMTLYLGDTDQYHTFYFTSEISRNAWWRHMSSMTGILSPYCSPSAPEANVISIANFVLDRFPYKASVPDFEFIKLLGAGTFGRVVQVRHRASGAIFAMKIIRKNKFHSIRNVIEVRRERSILEKLSNPYILRINATFQSESRIYFLLDYLPGGELLRHTQKAPGHHFGEDAARFYIAELAISLEYLRLRGIVHRDIKGDNLVLDEDGHLVLTDFGFAKKLSTSQRKDKTCCGTLAYIAPEMLQVHRVGYNHEVDWWSMGVVLFTVLTGYFPFLKTTRKDTVSAIINQPLQFPSKPVLTGEARDCCHKLMAKKPEMRISTLADLKAHPWYSNFNWGACERRQLRPPFVPISAGGDKKDTKQSDTEYEDERDVAATFVPTTIAPEQDIFGSFFANQEAAGSDREDSDSETDEDEDEAAVYDRVAVNVEETKATLQNSVQMLRPYFSSLSR